jgi:hypothetical protein
MDKGERALQQIGGNKSICKKNNILGLAISEVLMQVDRVCHVALKLLAGN